MNRCIRYPGIMAACLLGAVIGVPVVGASARTWTGLAGDGLASTAGNWEPTGAPDAATAIVLDATSSDALTWDAAATRTVASWTQTADYTGTVTFATVYPGMGAFTNFTVGGDGVVSNGVWTHAQNGAAEVYRLALTVGGDLVIGPAAAIDLDLKGYSSGDGGPGSLDQLYGSTHGGAVSGNPLPTYGSATQPTTLGSRGGYNQAIYAGGGAVRIEAGGTLTVNGRIGGNGGGIPIATYPGGSGGSIWLLADTLAGNGLIEANGGGSVHRGGGAGGRISLTQCNTIAFSGTVRAKGVAGSLTYGRGYDGTISFPAGYDLTLGAGGMTALVLGSDGDFEYVFGDIVIEDGASLGIDGHPNLEDGAGRSATLRATHIVIEAGGKLHAEGLGFPSRRGPGADSNDRSGGSYGGAGAPGTLTSAPFWKKEALPYGSASNPVNLGSGPGRVVGDGAAGGAVILEVAGTITVNGTLSAAAIMDGALGSGSGGSVNLACAVLEGSGTISAEGGLSGGNGGGGGGGRISLVKVIDNRFMGTLSVRGGNGGIAHGGAGHAGTIAFPEDYDLVLDTGRWPSLQLGADTNYSYRFGSIVISNGASLQLGIDPTADDYRGAGADIRAESITIEAGGGISASGLGFPARTGTGTSGNVNFVGATHGGMGGNNPTNTYGSVTEPSSAGSGSQSLVGGGIVHLAVTNTLTVNGTIAADGGGGSASGAAGGTINLRAGMLTGTGAIRANGGNGTGAGQQGGGGGRIAIRAPVNHHTGIITAYGGAGRIGETADGAAGTIYIVTDDQRSARTMIDNGVRVTTADTRTWLPATDGALPRELRDGNGWLMIRNGARAALSTNLVMYDLALCTLTDPTLYLEGWILKLNRIWHPDWGSMDQVVAEGGRILWARPTLVVIR